LVFFDEIADVFCSNRNVKCAQTASGKGTQGGFFDEGGAVNFVEFDG
jgi:hypothetical protein